MLVAAPDAPGGVTYASIVDANDLVHAANGSVRDAKGPIHTADGSVQAANGSSSDANSSSTDANASSSDADGLCEDANRSVHDANASCSEANASVKATSVSVRDAKGSGIVEIEQFGASDATEECLLRKFRGKSALRSAEGSLVAYRFFLNAFIIFMFLSIMAFRTMTLSALLNPSGGVLST